MSFDLWINDTEYYFTVHYLGDTPYLFG